MMFWLSILEIVLDNYIVEILESLVFRNYEYFVLN